jgi:hypothetical protein
MTDHLISSGSMPLVTSPVELPCDIGRCGEARPEGEPLRVKTGTRIRTDLTEPVRAEWLHDACEKDDGETRDEKNHSSHRKPPWPELDHAAGSQRSISRSHDGAGADPDQHRREPTRTAHRAMKAPNAAVQPGGSDLGRSAGVKINVVAREEPDGLRQPLQFLNE